MNKFATGVVHVAISVESANLIEVCGKDMNGDGRGASGGVEVVREVHIVLKLLFGGSGREAGDVGGRRSRARGFRSNPVA